VELNGGIVTISIGTKSTNDTINTIKEYMGLDDVKIIRVIQSTFWDMK
jgi:hypothetical protein